MKGWCEILISLYLCIFTTKVNVNAQQFKIFGDSILASNTPIQQDLEIWSGIKMENFATIGSGLQSGWVKSIPEQYYENNQPVPDIILMDGGGNDINSVRSQCISFTESCQQTVNHLVDIVKNLMIQMRKDGVKKIIYTGFYYIPEFKQVIDYGVDTLQEVCHLKDSCYFVDLRNVSVKLGWDGMHPITESYHDISKEIWKIMKQENITIS